MIENNKEFVFMLIQEKITHNIENKLNKINETENLLIPRNPNCAINKNAETTIINIEKTAYMRETSSSTISPSMEKGYLNDSIGKETEAIQRGIASERRLESESDLNFIAGFHF